MTSWGNRHPASEVIHQTNLHGSKMLCIRLPAGLFDEGLATDFEAVSQGYVSLTPLKVDFRANAALSAWLGDTEVLAPW